MMDDLLVASWFWEEVWKKNNGISWKCTKILYSCWRLDMFNIWNDQHLQWLSANHLMWGWDGPQTLEFCMHQYSEFYCVWILWAWRGGRADEPRQKHERRGANKQQTVAHGGLNKQEVFAPPCLTVSHSFTLIHIILAYDLVCKAFSFCFKSKASTKHQTTTLEEKQGARSIEQQHALFWLVQVLRFNCNCKLSFYPFDE